MKVTTSIRGSGFFYFTGTLSARMKGSDLVMEHVEDCSNSIEVFENDIDLYLHQFQDEQGFEDLRTVPQTVWNACLMYIQRHVFTNRNDLKQKKNIYTENTITETNCNSYDYELLNNICDYYIYITALYDKECSIYGFSKLVNIPYALIQEWGNNYKDSNRLSSASSNIYKKLTNEREQSLVAKLMSMKHPTAIAIVLNKDYSYNLPGVSKEVNKVSVSASELPKLGGNLSVVDGINQNPVQIAQHENVLNNGKNPQSLVE